MIAIVGSNGTRLVVWGIGETEEKAREDALFFVSDGGPICGRHYRDVGAMSAHGIESETVERIRAGMVDWPEVTK